MFEVIERLNRFFFGIAGEEDWPRDTRTHANLCPEPVQKPFARSRLMPLPRPLQSELGSWMNCLQIDRFVFCDGTLR